MDQRRRLPRRCLCRSVLFPLANPRADHKPVYDCVIRTREVGLPFSCTFNTPHHAARARRSTRINGTAPLSSSRARSGGACPYVSSLLARAVRGVLTGRPVAPPAAFCPRTPAKVALCALPPGVFGSPAATAAVLALCGAVAP